LASATYTDYGKVTGQYKWFKGNYELRILETAFGENNLNLNACCGLSRGYIEEADCGRAFSNV
jgi:hypothetical protein